MKNNPVNQGDQYIQKLNLLPHPEGGYYREMHRSQTLVSHDGQNRPAFTLIYYLLMGQDRSRLHRIKYEEAWHFLDGDPLEILTFHPDPGIKSLYLGLPLSAETSHYVPQMVIPGGIWFGARIHEPPQSATKMSEPANRSCGYSLVGCTVAPGFDFEDFELATSDTFSDDVALQSMLKPWL